MATEQNIDPLVDWGALYNRLTGSAGSTDVLPWIDMTAIGSDTYNNQGGVLKNIDLGTRGSEEYYNPVSNPVDPIELTEPQPLTEQQQYDRYLAAQQAQQAQEAAQTKAFNTGYLNDRRSELERLLGRISTSETQGLDKILKAYQDQMTQSENDKTKQMGVYDEQGLNQGLEKVSSFDKLNKGGNQAYRSLSQIIGRGAGTGSSAFRDALPNAIGSQISSGREAVLQDYGQNMQRIGKAKTDYESSFAEVLRDLANQKSNNESQFRTGMDTQRQGINTQLQDVLQKQTLNENPNADYAAVKAAITPYQQRNEQLSNQMEGYYNQYQPTMTPKATVAAKPDLKQFTVDRANVNAQNQGVVGDPYANILRKRLQENA